jgi:hypothetical protein
MRKVLQQVATCKNATAAWKTIEGTFGSQTRTLAVNVCMALATTHKGAMSVTEYVNKIHALGDEMAYAGKRWFHISFLDLTLNSIQLSQLF